MLLYVLLSGTVACLHRDPVSTPAEPAVSQPIASPEPAGVPWVGRYEFQDVECLYFISINADHTYTDGFLGGPILGGESDPGLWSEAGEMLLLTPAAGGRLVDGDRYLAASRNGRLFLLSSRVWAYACAQLATFDPGVHPFSWGAPSREYVGPRWFRPSALAKPDHPPPVKPDPPRDRDPGPRGGWGPARRGPPESRVWHSGAIRGAGGGAA